MPKNKDFENSFARVYNSLSPNQLVQGADEPSSNATDDRLLGFYTRSGVQTALTTYGFFDQLKLIGIRHPEWDYECDANGLYLFQFFESSNREIPIIEVKFERAVQPVPGVGNLPVLRLAKFHLRHPRRTFSANRSPSPGQRTPELGIRPTIMRALRGMCRRLQLEGIVVQPTYFHRAVTYASTFDCIYPEDQGRLLAVARDLPTRCQGSIEYASWALFLGHAIEYSMDELKPAVWSPPLMISMRDPEKQNALFTAQDYLRKVNDVMCSREYRVNRIEFSNDLWCKGIIPLDTDLLQSTMEAFGWS